jgi:hypothetical protein
MAKEWKQGDTESVSIVDNMTIEVERTGQFSFDGVFAPGSQEDVFEECRDLIQSAVDGHNVTIFTYGQTGAGKTYTVYGTPEKAGIAERSVYEVFEIVSGLRRHCNVTVTGSMIELYNNVVVDLLRPVRQEQRTSVTGTASFIGTSSSSGSRMISRGSVGSIPSDDSPKTDAPAAQVNTRGSGKAENQFYEREVKEASELLSLLDRGIAQRRVSPHAMNLESSRSHLIFTIRVTSTIIGTDDSLSGKILLCDLGGSERLKKSESMGRHRKEAIEVNKSLTALGDVIAAVAKKQKQVPYRHHKLTQIMQDSLGGTAKTLMFVNCSPATSNLQETVMSLNYATRVRKITNAGRTSSRPASRMGSRPTSPMPRSPAHWSPARTPGASPPYSPSCRSPLYNQQVPKEAWCIDEHEGSEESRSGSSSKETPTREPFQKFVLRVSAKSQLEIDG